MAPSDNRREFTRVPVKLQAEVRCEKEATLTGPVSDLSLNGLSLACSQLVAKGSACQVRLLLNAGGEATVAIEANGEITRSTNQELAVAFREMDPDSLSHLRNLLIYNSLDPDKVSDEFLGHLGLKRR